MVTLNVLTLIYSVVQLIAGLNPNSPSFSGEIGLQPPREAGRLIGPFGVVGLTFKHTVVSVFVLAVMLLTMKGSRSL